MSFICSICSSKYTYDYFGRSPPYDSISYFEPVFTIRSPFPPSSELTSGSPGAICLGGICAVCKADVCVSCSSFYCRRYCKTCVASDHRLTEQLAGKKPVRSGNLGS
eukprot:GHVQ01022922.1.p2 GENE.GHVQ01022922.1~~GHVQ01022922.1.p2  ORF type:complete len:107 (+),score=9.70 GHVQ01022922.1:51-371(+)